MPIASTLLTCARVEKKASITITKAITFFISMILKNIFCGFDFFFLVLILILYPSKNFSGRQHSGKWYKQIDPESSPCVCRKSTGKGSGRVHTKTGYRTSHYHPD